MLRRLVYLVLTLFVLMNLVAFMHAWRFTHFSDEGVEKTAGPEGLSALQKAKVLFTGVTNPRPVNNGVPARPYETILLKSNREIECWYIPVPQAKGTVVLFHGYASRKSASLSRSEVFNQLGYTTLLVDFMGSGGSEGNVTTIGYKEAEQVKTCVDYLADKGEKEIILFGSSLGAAAIMRAVGELNTRPSAVILECPFGSMQEAVEARFENMGVPVFPMANLLVFWGGVQQGFWAFGHEPREYAKAIDIPVLLLYGKKDDRVRQQEIEGVYANLAGYKQLITYSEEGHSIRVGPPWISDVGRFLSQNNSR